MSKPHPALIELAAGRPLSAVTGHRELIASAVEHRMQGLLWSRVITGEFEMTPDQERRLAMLNLRVVQHHEMLWNTLSDVAEALRREGVEFCVLKGVANEARWYDRLGERPSSDIDLWVGPPHLTRFGDIVQILQPNHPLRSTAQDLIDRRHLQSVDLRLSSGIDIDLHADPLKLGIVTRSAETMWHGRILCSMPGRVSISVLDPQASTVLALIHLNKDGLAPLLGFADLHRILNNGVTDMESVASILHNEGLETHGQMTLSAVHKVLAVRAPALDAGTYRARLWRILWPSCTHARQPNASTRLRRYSRYAMRLTARGRTIETLRWIARLAAYWLHSRPQSRRDLGYLSGRLSTSPRENPPKRANGMIPIESNGKHAGVTQVISVVGMSRSGTTFLCKLLATIDPSIAIEMEPVMIWKAGSFRYLSDENYRVRPRPVAWIRKKLTSNGSGGRILVEKTPHNVYRPYLVHAAFPTAKIVYIERDDFRCIASNVRRTQRREALSPRIVVRKYIKPEFARREPDLAGFKENIDAVGGRSIFRQLRMADLPQFLLYVLRLYIRRLVGRQLPFGPKIAGFDQILRTQGTIEYYIQCLQRAKLYKKDFSKLFGNRFAEFQLARLQTEPSEVVRLSTFCGIECSENLASSIVSGFDRDLLDKFRPLEELERKILQSLNERSAGSL